MRALCQPVLGAGRDDALQSPVVGGVVGMAVLPAVPDDVEPSAGQDADRVGVVVAACSGAVVEVGGPRVDQSAVSGEVVDSVAQLLVARPPETDGAKPARLSGRGCDAGKAGERLGGG